MLAVYPTTRLFSFFIIIFALFSCSSGDGQSECTPDSVDTEIFQNLSIYRSSTLGERINSIAVDDVFTCPDNQHLFIVDETVEFQSILGFGASFLEAGAISLNALEPEDQETVLRNLFDKDQGAGFSAMRTDIAASDFMSAGPWYSYNESPNDVDMANFTIQRDLETDGLIPYIQRAKTHGDFILQATMDFPPDWMLFDINTNKNVDPQYYDALAKYYLNYLNSYASNGITIDYISLFNEPQVYTKILPHQISTLIREHVGPLFESENVTTQLQACDYGYRRDAGNYMPIILQDPGTLQYIDILGYHGYDYLDYLPGSGDEHFDAITGLNNDYPQFQLWMSEVCKITPPIYDFKDGDFWGNMIFSDLESNASAWTYWNMILDQNGGPWLISIVHNDPPYNSQHPVVIIDRDQKTVHYTGLYYYLAHFSKFVRPDSVRIETIGSHLGIRAISFKRPDDRIVVQIMNSTSENQVASLNNQGASISLKLPPISITTTIWETGSQSGIPQ